MGGQWRVCVRKPPAVSVPQRGYLGKGRGEERNAACEESSLQGAPEGAGHR